MIMRVFIVILLLASACAAVPNQAAPATCWWFTGGLGKSAVASNIGKSDNQQWYHSRMSMSIDIQPRTFCVFAVHITRLSAYGGPLPEWEEAGVNTKISTFGILLGKRAVAKDVGFVSASAGIAFVETMVRYHTKQTVGLPMELHAALTPGGVAGLDFEVFGNLNASRSEVGVAVNLIFGKVL
jgi:hypothetical protein